ncbi:MAG: hypothetical protein H6815_13285 [Phycisphaeraceae bacterium]|nr:hypothetical protein [Phycisphaeraceae bacterium]
MSHAAPTSRTGIILAEAIAGTVVLAIVLVISLGITGRALRAQATGERTQTAAMLLDGKLNEVLMLGPEGYLAENKLEGTFAAPFDNFWFDLSIKGGRSGDPYDVSVTVYWTSRNRTRSETVGTMIAPHLGDDPTPERKPEETLDREL